MSQQPGGGNPFQAGAKIVGSVLREWLVSRKERQMVEKRAEAQKEVLDLRQNSASREMLRGGTDSNGSESGDSLSRATEVVQEYDDLLATAEQQEECDFCRALISELRSRPIEEQRVLLPELKAFLDGAKRNADRDELIRSIRGNDRLADLVQDVIGVDIDSNAQSGRSKQAAKQSDSGSPPTDTDGNVVPSTSGSTQTRLH